MLPGNYLDSIAAVRENSEPVHLPWPAPGNPGKIPSSATFEWRAFVLQFSLHPALPLIVSAKFEHAQKLYILTWIDFDLIKAGELIAMMAVEPALTDRYGGKELDRRRKIITKNAEDEKRKVSEGQNGRAITHPCRLAEIHGQSWQLDRGPDSLELALRSSVQFTVCLTVRPHRTSPISAMISRMAHRLTDFRARAFWSWCEISSTTPIGIKCTVMVANLLGFFDVSMRCE